MKPRCEWNPKASVPAGDRDGDCPNTATLSLGVGLWHVCESCADLPFFSRFSSRRQIDPAEDPGLWRV